MPTPDVGFLPRPGDGRNEKLLISPGVVGVKELAPLSRLRPGGNTASILLLSRADELRCRWLCRSTGILPADSLLTRPSGMTKPALAASSASRIAVLESWLWREGAPR